MLANGWGPRGDVCLERVTDIARLAIRCRPNISTAEAPATIAAPPTCLRLDGPCARVAKRGWPLRLTRTAAVPAWKAVCAKVDGTSTECRSCPAAASVDSDEARQPGRRGPLMRVLYWIARGLSSCP